MIQLFKNKNALAELPGTIIAVSASHATTRAYAIQTLISSIQTLVVASASLSAAKLTRNLLTQFANALKIIALFPTQKSVVRRQTSGKMRDQLRSVQPKLALLTTTEVLTQSGFSTLSNVNANAMRKPTA